MWLIINLFVYILAYLFKLHPLWSLWIIVLGSFSVPFPFASFYSSFFPSQMASTLVNDCTVPAWEIDGKYNHKSNTSSPQVPFKAHQCDWSRHFAFQMTCFRLNKPLNNTRYLCRLSLWLHRQIANLNTYQKKNKNTHIEMSPW